MTIDFSKLVTKKKRVEVSYPLPAPWNRRDPAVLEAPIMRAVIGLLRFRGCWVTRIEGGGKLLHRKGELGIGASEMTGLPDVLAVLKGQLFGLEVKAPGGKLSQSQLTQLQAMQRSGARVAVVLGTDGLWDWIRTGEGAAGEIQGISIVC
jgi:hypothetical protein